VKSNRNLKLLIVLIIIVFVMTHAPRALTIRDEVIKQRIEYKAADSFQLKGTKVEVVVENGYVVLHGTVGLFIQKMLYEQIAWNTTRVVEVDNEIRVVARFLQTDSAIERKIMELFQTYQRFQGVNLKMTVKEGIVHIRANFKNPKDVLFLKRRVGEIAGVTDINIQAKFIV